MKKSHRKDVILARIIFAAFCLFLVAIIVGAVVLVRKHKTVLPQESQASQERQDSEQIPGLTPDTQMGQPTESESQEPPKVFMRTTSKVNLRTEANTSCEVITVLAEGTQLELISEENGWALVQYLDQTGYVSAEFLEEVTAESDTSVDE